MSIHSQNKKNAEIIGVSSLSEENTIKSRFKDGHAPALKRPKGRERLSESRDLRPAPVEKPSDFRLIKNAEIIGVFSKAVYLEADGKVYLFHDKKWGYVPFGIAVENIEDFIRERNFEVGKSVEIEIPEPKKAIFHTAEKISEKRIAEIEKIIAESGSPDGIIGYYNQFDSVKANVDALFKALCENRCADEYAVKLIGLGRGLTPSGDDFLSGMFSLFFAAGYDVSSIAKAVRNNLTRTSKISGAYLSAVLEKEHFTIYENAVKAFFSDSAEYANAVLPLGASSGTDTLCGALFAAKVMIR